MVPGDGRLVFAQFLTGVEFNHLAARSRGLLDTFKYGEMVPGPCLAANEDAALAGEIEEWQAFDDNPEEPVN